MSTETKWRIVWASWLAAGVVAETIAIRTEHDHAPLSHHLRRNTHILGKTSLGQVALLAAATWLHRHLYSSESVSPGGISKYGGQQKILPIRVHVKGVGR